MKRIIIVFILLLTVGCTNKEKIFKEYAISYYDEHMSMIDNVDAVTITLSDLEKGEYDLKKLAKCDKSSSVILSLEAKSIKSAKILLKC